MSTFKCWGFIQSWLEAKKLEAYEAVRDVRLSDSGNKAAVWLHAEAAAVGRS